MSNRPQSNSSPQPPSLGGSVDFLASSPSRRRQKRAAPQGERKLLFFFIPNDCCSARAEALEARSSHLSTLPSKGGKAFAPFGKGGSERSERGIFSAPNERAHHHFSDTICGSDR